MSHNQSRDDIALGLGGALTSAQVIHAYFMTGLCAAGVVANAVAIWRLPRVSRNSSNSTHFRFLKHLFAADLLMCLLNVALFPVTAIQGELHHASFVCAAQSVVALLFAAASIVLLVCLSLDRYSSIVRKKPIAGWPVSSACSRCLARCLDRVSHVLPRACGESCLPDKVDWSHAILLAAWALAGAIGFGVLAPGIPYGVSTSGMFCSSLWWGGQDATNPANMWNIVHPLASFVTLLSVMCLISWHYYRIYRCIQKSRDDLTRLTVTQFRNNKKHAQVAFNMFLLVLVFVANWAPYLLVIIGQMVTRRPFAGNWILVDTIGTTMGFANSVVNPLLYLWLNRAQLGTDGARIRIRVAAARRLQLRGTMPGAEVPQVLLQQQLERGQFVRHARRNTLSDFASGRPSGGSGGGGGGSQFTSGAAVAAAPVAPGPGPGLLRRRIMSDQTGAVDAPLASATVAQQMMQQQKTMYERYREYQRQLQDRKVAPAAAPAAPAAGAAIDGDGAQRAASKATILRLYDPHAPTRHEPDEQARLQRQWQQQQPHHHQPRQPSMQYVMLPQVIHVHQYSSQPRHEKQADQQQQQQQQQQQPVRVIRLPLTLPDIPKLSLPGTADTKAAPPSDADAGLHPAVLQAISSMSSYEHHVSSGQSPEPTSLLSSQSSRHGIVILQQQQQRADEAHPPRPVLGNVPGGPAFSPASRNNTPVTPSDSPVSVAAGTRHPAAAAATTQAFRSSAPSAPPPPGHFKKLPKSSHHHRHSRSLSHPDLFLHREHEHEHMSMSSRGGSASGSNSRQDQHPQSTRMGTAPSSRAEARKQRHHPITLHQPPLAVTNAGGRASSASSSNASKRSTPPGRAGSDADAPLAQGGAGAASAHSSPSSTADMEHRLGSVHRIVAVAAARGHSPCELVRVPAPSAGYSTSSIMMRRKTSLKPLLLPPQQLFAVVAGIHVSADGTPLVHQAIPESPPTALATTAAAAAAAGAGAGQVEHGHKWSQIV